MPSLWALVMGGWTYMLRCADGSYYVGSTSYDEVEKRVAEHNGARYFGYTVSRRPVHLVWSRWFDELRDAHEAERRLKGGSRAKKMALIAGDETELVARSRRRAGKPERSLPAVTPKQFTVLAQEVGARMTPQRPLAVPRKPSSVERAGGSDIPVFRLVSRRHPEVRAGAKRRGAPKDD